MFFGSIASYCVIVNVSRVVHSYVGRIGGVSHVHFVLYADIVNFTLISSYHSATEVVNLLNYLFCLLDKLTDKYEAFKADTVGDAYVAVTGLPTFGAKATSESVTNIAHLALVMLGQINNLDHENASMCEVKLRIGLATGPVSVGMIGMKIPKYCVFGETVNLATAMEERSQPNRILITNYTRNFLVDTGIFETLFRGQFKIEDTTIDTYWLVGSSFIDKELDIFHNTNKGKESGGILDQRIKQKAAMKQLRSSRRIYDTVNPLPALEAPREEDEENEEKESAVSWNPETYSINYEALGSRDEEKDREYEVKDREDEVKDREDDVKDRENEVKDRENEVKDREAEVKNREDEVKNRENEVKDCKDEFNDRDYEVTNRENEIKDRKDEVNDRENEVKGRETEVKDRENEVKDRENDAKDRENEVKGRENDAKDHGNEVKGRENEVKGRENDAKDRENDAKDREKEVKGRENEVMGRDNDAKDRENEVKGRENDAKDRENEVKGRENEVKDRENDAKDHGNDRNL